MILVSAKNITKAYSQGASSLPILRGVSLDIQQGEAVCILGASGAGKSTLLHILGTLDRPDSGELLYREQNLINESDEALSQFRNDKMGFVFQFHHLLQEFSALENVAMPCRIHGESAAQAQGKAEAMLELVGLKDRRSHFPSELSGGELQRVAIARALVRRPEILFADEPTGNLDSGNSGKIQDLFFELKERVGLTLVVVTHDLNFARRFGKVLKIHDGKWST